MEVRPATLSDLPDILRMMKVCWPSIKLPDALPMDMPHLHRAVEGWLSAPDQFGVFVAETDGRVVGASAVTGSPLWLHPQPIAFGLWLWVDKEARAKGAGRAITDAAETWARDRNLPCVTWAAPIRARDTHKALERGRYGALETNYIKSL